MFRFGPFPTVNYSMPDDSAGGGSGSSADSSQQQQQQDQNQQQQQDQNNIDPSLAEFQKMWDTDSSDDGDNNKQQQQQQTPSSDQINQQFRDHIAGLKLTEGVDLDKIKTGLESGDLTSLNEAFNNIAGKVYQSAILDSNKLLTSKIDAAVEKAVEKSRGTVQADFAITKMQESLPFTKKSEINPIAVAVLKQFMNKGSSQEEAIDKVKGFFGHLTKVSAKEVGINLSPAGKPNGGDFKGSFSDSNDDPSDEIDFEALFAPKST